MSLDILNFISAIVILIMVVIILIGLFSDVGETYNEYDTDDFVNRRGK